MTLPEDFIAAARRLFPEGECADFLQAVAAEEPHTSVRLNRAKLQSAAAAGGTVRGFAAGTEVGRVPWCGEGFYLARRFPFTFDPLFHAGAYYVQEASSMSLALLSRFLDGPQRVLDLCAAPGGKSTLLCGVLPSGSLLVSNEVVPQRAAVLRENMQKWGHPGCIVASAHAGEWGALGGVFDLVVADVPCSGEGMFRKDAEAVAQWSLRNVEQCARRQRDIVAGVWPALRAGGLFLYSTCTFNTDENEDNVRWICRHLGAEPVVLPAAPGWGIAGSLPEGGEEMPLPACRFLPHRLRGEGFFCCLLRKTSDSRSPAVARAAKAKARGARGAVPMKVPPLWTDCLQQGAQPWVLWDDGSAASAVGGELPAFLALLRERGVKVLSAGVPLCVARGRDWLPHPALALSLALRRGSFPEVDLPYAQAVAYLRRESLQLPEGTPRGIVLLTYASVPLGFAKNLGNRSNNLFPAEWRIRTTHVPGEATSLLA